MLRRLLRAVRNWTDRDDDGGFVRSRLDASVLTSHGQGNADAERELESVCEEAEKLAEADRHR